VSGQNPAHATVHSPAACHAWSAGRPVGPWPGGPVQPQMRLAQCAWSPRAGRRGGALAGGLMAASRRQGLGLKRHDYAADAPGMESGGRAHRGGGTTMGRSDSSVWRRAVASSPEGGSAVTPASSGSYRGG
jgi:hypothetical protein